MPKHSEQPHLFLQCLFLLLKHRRVGIQRGLGIGAELHLGHLEGRRGGGEEGRGGGEREGRREEKGE